MTEQAWHGEPWHAALIEACALGLREPMPVTVHPEEVDAVLRQAHLDRIETALVDAIERRVITWPHDDRDRLQQQLVVALTSTVMVESHLAQLAGILGTTDIRWRVLKGAAIAHLDFADPALRLFGDVDLLIHSEDWDEIVALLGRHGYTRPMAERRPGFDVRFGKGATFERADGLELDLHLRFAIGRFGMLCRPDDLFTVRPDVFEVGGEQIPALAAPYRWLHACFHEAIGGFRGLRAARDVAHLILSRHVDWETAQRLSSAWGVDAVLAAAIRDTWRLMKLGSVDHPAIIWADGYEFSAAERSALRVMRDTGSYRRHALSAVGAIGTTREQARYLLALTLPAVSASTATSASRRSRRRASRLLGRGASS